MQMENLKETKEQLEVLDQCNNETHHELLKPNRLNPALSELSEILFRRLITSLLNKLTPENFSTLSKKMKSLPIDTPSRMLQVVDMIHTKAVREWKYCALYAKICDLLQNIEVIDELGNTKQFSVYLIAHCETFFRRRFFEDLRFGRKKFEIDFGFEQNNEESLMREYEEIKRKYVRKSVGNCQFIGELFKVYLIHPKIIFLILDQLLKTNGDVTMECACTLLTTIGPFYEEKIGELPAIYFNKLELLLSSGEISSRIRFMIQDVLDLKKNFWRFRRLLELPKTLQQIDQDVMEEEKTSKLKESMSRLNYILTKHKSKDRGRVSSRTETYYSEWTNLSNHYFNDIFEQKNRRNQTESSVSTRSTLSFKDCTDEIRDVPWIPAESIQKVVSGVKLNEELVTQQTIPSTRNFPISNSQNTDQSRLMKYSVEFLKSLSELPQCKKSVELPDNLPKRFYPNYEPAKIQMRSHDVSLINKERRRTSILKHEIGNTIDSVNQLQVSDSVGHTDDFKQWSFGVAANKASDKQNVQNSFNQPPMFSMDKPQLSSSNSFRSSLSNKVMPSSSMRKLKPYPNRDAIEAGKILRSGSAQNIHPSLRESSVPWQQTPSRNASHNSKLPAPSSASSTPMLSADELKRAAVTIFQEYDKNYDLIGSIDTFEKRFNPKQIRDAVQEMMAYILKNKPKSAAKCGVLLANLIKRGCVTKKHFIEAGKFFYDLADDLFISCPDMWISLAEIANPLIAHDCLQISDLQTEILNKPLLDHIKSSNEKVISSVKSNEALVTQQTIPSTRNFPISNSQNTDQSRLMKYSVEFLKSLSELPQCKKSVELPDNLPKRFYPNYEPSKIQMRSHDVSLINKERRRTSILKHEIGNTIDSVNQLQVSDSVDPTGDFEEWSFGVAANKASDKQNVQNSFNQPPMFSMDEPQLSSSNRRPSSSMRKPKPYPNRDSEQMHLRVVFKAGKILRSGSARNIHPSSRESSVPWQHSTLPPPSFVSSTPILSADELKRTTDIIYQVYSNEVSFLRRVLELMYDLKLISYNSFMLWKNFNTTRGVAMAQLKQFFDYLETQKAEDSDNR